MTAAAAEDEEVAWVVVGVVPWPDGLRISLLEENVPAGLMGGEVYALI